MKKVGIPEILQQELARAFPNGFVLIGQSPNGQAKAVLYDPDKNYQKYLRSIYRLADAVNKDGEIILEDGETLMLPPEE